MKNFLFMLACCFAVSIASAQTTPRPQEKHPVKRTQQDTTITPKKEPKKVTPASKARKTTPANKTVARDTMAIPSKDELPVPK